ncbi:MAG: RAMP superfamily CRISPR-associated protein [Alkaliphilus sp.]
MKYITFTITAKENLKIGSSVFQSDVESTRSYITGSAVRGAFIYNVMMENQGIDVSQDEKYKSMFFGGGVKFLNANICDKSNGLASFPFPLCYIANKQEMKKGKDKTAIYNDFAEHSESYDKYRKAEFFIKEDDVAIKIKPKKTYTLHITKQKTAKNGKKDVGIYRYEAIKKGQSFSGELIVEEEYLDECKRILRKGVFYLGGSKGTGYGRCEIDGIKTSDLSNSAYLKEGQQNFANDIYIYFLSDTIIYDANGCVSTIIDEKYLEEKLDLEGVEYVDSRVSNTVIGGYNNKWGCRLPQINGIKAGSVLKYSFDANIDLEKISALEAEGFGQRREEGFGQVMILSEISFNTVEEREIKVSNEEINLSKADKKLLRKILKNIYDNQLERQIEFKLYQIFKKEKVSFRIKNTQRGRLVNLFRVAQTMSKSEAIPSIEKFLEDVVRRQSTNKTIVEQFKDSKIEGKSISEYIYEILGMIKRNDIQALERLLDIKADEYELDGVKPHITSDELFAISMKYLEKLFYRSMERGDLA